MKMHKPFLLLSGLFMLTGAVLANDGSSTPCLIQGYVKDAVTKKPVSGVVVLASAPGNSAPKEVVTDADGFYHFSELPSPTVNLEFGKKGYQSYKRANVVVKDKSTVKLNIDFRREELNTDAESSADDSEYPLLRMLDM